MSYYLNILETQKTCNKCKSCCHTVRIAFKKDSEAGRLIKQKYEDGDFPKEHKLYEELDHPLFWVYDSKGEHCLFLEYATYSCSIHQIKPIICKMFPLKWDNKLQYYIALCPLAFVIPLKDIYRWKEGNEHEINDITYYVNPEEIQDLLPLSYILDKYEKFKEILF